MSLDTYTVQSMLAFEANQANSPRMTTNDVAITVLPEPNDQIMSLLRQRQNTHTRTGQWAK